MTPEAVFRLGAKWYAATNKGCLGSFLRCIVKTQNFDGYGKIYERILMVEPPFFRRNSDLLSEKEDEREKG